MIVSKEPENVDCGMKYTPEYIWVIAIERLIK